MPPGPGWRSIVHHSKAQEGWKDLYQQESKHPEVTRNESMRQRKGQDRGI